MNKTNAPKLLFLVPAKSASGGIKNYFQVIRDELNIPVEYMLRGARKWPYRSTGFKEAKRIINDLINFKKRITRGDIKLVQTSTSLGLFSVIRDGITIKIANKYKIKTVVFFRGWDVAFEKKIEEYLLPFFKFLFFKADSFIVLSKNFKRKLLEWGYKGNIYVETTVVDTKLLNNLTIEKIIQKKKERRLNGEFNILFLARIEKEKGIYEAIETFYILKKNNHIRISLIIAGTGKELENVKKYINKKQISDVKLVGHVESQEKKDIFFLADVYLFPTYTEGMPNSVLEAMAFGLPVITRSVGAIPEIIENGKNGFHTMSKSPKVFANYVQRFINDEAVFFHTVKNNYNMAFSKFTTNVVVKRLEKIYKAILDETINSTT